jgi:hypothetical protein
MVGVRADFPEWRKLPRDVRDALATSEDFLTARTLGAFRFLSTPALGMMLQRFGIESSSRRPDVQLWPRLDGCEPDALIESTEISIVVECKFIGSRLGYYPTQLGREWRALAARRVERRYLLVITNDGSEPRVPSLAAGAPPTCTPPLVSIGEQIRQYCALLGAHIPEPAGVDNAVRWCAWSQLYVHAQAVLAEVASHGPDAAVLREILGVLAELGCEPFAGWKCELKQLPAPRNPVWLRPSSPPQLWRYKLPSLDAEVRPPWTKR